MIRDQIVEKCHSRTLKQKLLQQESLDLSKTVKIARSEETASQEALLLSSGTKENPIQIDRLAHGSNTSKIVHVLSVRWNGRTHCDRVWCDKLQMQLVQESSTPAEGLPI